MESSPHRNACAQVAWALNEYERCKRAAGNTQQQCLRVELLQAQDKVKLASLRKQHDGLVKLVKGLEQEGRQAQKQTRSNERKQLATPGMQHTRKSVDAAELEAAKERNRQTEQDLGVLTEEICRLGGTSNVDSALEVIWSKLLTSQHERYAKACDTKHELDQMAQSLQRDLDDLLEQLDL